MGIKEAKEVRDKIFRKLVKFSVEDKTTSITDAIVAPADTHHHDHYLMFVNSQSIIEQAIMKGISKDDRAVAAMGIGMDDYEWTIMIKVYDPKNDGSESGWIFANDYPSIKDQIPIDVWNKL